MARYTLGEENQHSEGCRSSSIANTQDILVENNCKTSGASILETFHNITLVSQHWHFVQWQYTHFNKCFTADCIAILYTYKTHASQTQAYIQYKKHAYSLILETSCKDTNQPPLGLKTCIM